MEWILFKVSKQLDQVANRTILVGSIQWDSQEFCKKTLKSMLQNIYLLSKLYMMLACGILNQTYSKSRMVKKVTTANWIDWFTCTISHMKQSNLHLLIKDGTP
jgi:hypothetical protein